MWGVHTCAHATGHIWSEDNSKYLGPGDQTQIITLGSNHLYPLRHPPGLHVNVFENNSLIKWAYIILSSLLNLLQIHKPFRTLQLPHVSTLTLRRLYPCHGSLAQVSEWLCAPVFLSISWESSKSLQHSSRKLSNIVKYINFYWYSYHIFPHFLHIYPNEKS